MYSEFKTSISNLVRPWLKIKTNTQKGSGDRAPWQSAYPVIARCGVQTPGGSSTKHTKTRKHLYTGTQKFRLSIYRLVPQTNLDAVVKKVLAYAGTNYKGLGGSMEQVLLIVLG